MRYAASWDNSLAWAVPEMNSCRVCAAWLSAVTFCSTGPHSWKCKLSESSLASVIWSAFSNHRMTNDQPGNSAILDSRCVAETVREHIGGHGHRSQRSSWIQSQESR